MKKISLEEHFATHELAQLQKEWYERTGFPQVVNPDPENPMHRKLRDVDEMRLPEMDANDIALQVLSISEPGVQKMTDAEAAIAQAKRFNEAMAEVVRRHPTRFAAFATLPLQDPQAAADELERTVTQMSFKGAMVNGHTNGQYLDEPQFEVVWERAQALDVPIYLHPTNPIPDQIKIYDDHTALLGAAWNWGVETGTHALRIVCGGTFEKYPNAKLILGHMGEMIPYVLNRLDGAFRRSPKAKTLPQLPSAYFRRNAYITITGNLSVPALLCAVMVIGIDHVLFSVDYPFQSTQDAVQFIDNVPLSEVDRAKLCYLNAEQLLKLG